MNLTIRSLSKNYTGPEGIAVQAVRDCSLEIGGGSFTVIAGRSGSGKTTLLKIIAGLENADSGTVEFSTEETGSLPVIAIPGRTISQVRPKTGFMFQDPRLLPWLTVEQNLALAFLPPKNKAEKTAIQNEIHRVLAMTGLADRSSSLPRELSGGMAQRAALARSLCRNPELLLLDEPLGSLDAFTRIRLREELEKLWHELGFTAILVTHDIEEAVFFGERVFLMNRGTIACEVPIPLERPRDCHSPEFQEYFKRIENEIGISNEQ